MIAYSDKTRIALSQELLWGTAPSNGYANLHLLAENLTPQIRSFQPQQLGHTHPPIRTEEMVSGEIEMPLSAASLIAVLPYLMQAQAKTHDFSMDGSIPLDANGCLPLPTVTSAYLEDQDYVWMDVDDEQKSGFYPVKVPAVQPFLKGDTNLDPVIDPVLSLHRFTEGTLAQSACIARNYGPDDVWHALTGLMVQRLVLDLEEDRPPTMTASVIGRAMETISPAPDIANGQRPTLLDTGQHLEKIVFSDPETGTEIDAGHIVMTGIRIVLDRVGMVPQFGLGEVHPRLIMPGQLALSGNVSVLVNGHHFFTWLENRNRVRLTLIMQSSTSGFVMDLPQIEISGVDGGANASDQPVRGVFHFTDSVSNGQSPVRFFLKN